MSRAFLTNLDMNQNEIQNAILQPLATAPTSGKLGQIYYNSTDKKLYQHDGSAWVCVGVTYTIEYGTVSSNTVPLKLVGSDGTTDTVNIKGAGGATLSVSGDVLTITTKNDNTTYTFTEVASDTGYTVTIKPSSGADQSFTVPLSDGANAGLMSPSQHSKLEGIETGANKYTHPTGDGNMHVPATGTSNNGKVLKAGSAAGSAFWGALSKSDVGLGNVDNTSDDNKPVSTAMQAALDALESELQADIKKKANLSSPTFTGTPKAPTASAGTNNTQIATTAFVHDVIDAAVASLPADQFLDLTKTTYVDSFTWSSTTYPGSTNPSLDGKAVLVLALTDGTDTTYSFVSLNDLVDAYTGESPITVSGGTISHVNSGASAGAYGDSSSMTPGFGEKFKALCVKVNLTGHVYEISSHDVAIPSDVASSSAAGLMSAEDKQQLNALANIFDTILTGDEVTITAGETSVETNRGADLGRMIYKAYDAETFEEVIVDCGVNTRGQWMFSINGAYENDILIVYGTYTAGM